MTREAAALVDRRVLVAELLAARGDALVVAGLGSPAWDVTAAGDRPENLPLWGGMGQAVPIGLGLALMRPERRVLVITGDGEMLMGIGSLAVVGAQAPANLAVLVLDNELFGETGNQPGLTAHGVDIAAMAKGAGLRACMQLASADQVAQLREFLLYEPGPVLAVAKVARSAGKAAYPSNDGRFLAKRMRAALVAD